MNKLCVYCGSSSGLLPAYSEAARALGQELVKQNIGLVYGGASVGLMGIIADQVMNNGGEVIGVMPAALVEKEVSHCGLSELVTVSSMHERKAVMAERSDGFIALPGGLGTMEELFEILTWSQLGFHSKPCGLLNTEGYYDKLSEFLDHAVQQQFVKALHRNMLISESDPGALLCRMRSHQPPKADKWIGREQT